MKILLMCTLCLCSGWAVADAGAIRPTDRYFFIGEFESGNPFNWDNDTVSSNVREWSEGVVFELDQGQDVEIREITVTCSRGDVCARLRGGDVARNQPLYLRFRRDLDVAHIQIRSKPLGFSVPSPRLSVYLRVRRGW